MSTPQNTFAEIAQAFAARRTADPGAAKEHWERCLEHAWKVALADAAETLKSHPLGGAWLDDEEEEAPVSPMRRAENFRSLLVAIDAIAGANGRAYWKRRFGGPAVELTTPAQVRALIFFEMGDDTCSDEEAELLLALVGIHDEHRGSILAARDRARAQASARA